ncbi:hypothetical protein IQ276_033270 [Desmonostoc muscorum LEGE 12446]|uniref:Uncharacterized protein n=1 Tax=Desmonostoc muscorum LEGE 12446 TaxID=1828758 RepID=A0A8J7A4S4_DESMC|nr:hypothetical protein [Desmonostoc muscorum]MCF2151203.1 hypothetical protein [Desmonostoc muscorum LEGE 12446]
MTIQQTNSTSDAIVLEALKEALKELDLVLPDSLQQQINSHLAQVLANPQTKEVENLIQLVRDNETLYKKYRVIRQNLFDEYQAKQRNKGFPPQEKDTPPTTTPNILDNVVAPMLTYNELPQETQGQANTTTKGQKSQ